MPEQPRFRLHQGVRAAWLERRSRLPLHKGGVASRTLTEDLGGTWYEYGIGADFNATEQLHFWAELERGDGGEVDTDYRATIGMRYAW